MWLYPSEMLRLPCAPMGLLMRLLCLVITPIILWLFQIIYRSTHINFACRSPPSGLSPWGSFADNMFRKVRISGAAALQGRSPFHFGGPAFHGRRSSRCSSEAELAIEEVRSQPNLAVTKSARTAQPS